MKIKKFLMCMMIVFLFISQCFICNNKTTKVSALDELTVKAVEHYDRKTTVGLGEFGKINVVVTISHNMTTGKSCVYAVKETPEFSKLYPFLKFKSVSTSPSQGVYFTGAISIKVTVTYLNDIPGNSKTFTKDAYIDL